MFLITAFLIAFYHILFLLILLLKWSLTSEAALFANFSQQLLSLMLIFYLLAFLNFPYVPFLEQLVILDVQTLSY